MGNLRRAIEELEHGGLEVVSTSCVYETAPVGPPQPDFLNAVCEVETDLEPAHLVQALKRIEATIGRVPGQRWGPREIDLDLLLFGQETIDEPEVSVPHPELTKRAFVLVPILEIAPDLELPSGEPLSAFCEPNPPAVRRVAEQLRAPAGG